MSLKKHKKFFKANTFYLFTGSPIYHYSPGKYVFES